LVAWIQEYEPVTSASATEVNGIAIIPIAASELTITAPMIAFAEDIFE
jgi:hypothetical protein